MYQHTLSHKIPDYAFSSLKLQSKITLSLIPTVSLSFSTDYKYLLHIQYGNPRSDTSRDSILQPEWRPPPGPIRFHVQRRKNPETELQYQREWTMMKEVLSSYTGSESFDVDMLDSILC